MGRPPLPVGTCGNITTRTIAPGVVQASTWVRDTDGKRRRVERRGKTKTAATNALKAALVDRTPPPDPQSITPETRVRDLGKRWLDSRAADERVRKQSVEAYETILAGLVYPAIGGLQLREIATSRIQDLYDTLGSSKATRAATPLRMMFDVAVRCDIWPANPARQAKPPAKGHVQGRVLTPAEMLDLRQKIGRWASGDLSDSRRSYKVLGAARRALPDVFDLAVATGCRPSEILAFRFDDADLSATPAKLTVTGTLIRLRSVGTTRQAFTKTDAGHRELTLPAFGERVVRDRFKTRRLGVLDNLIFPSDDDHYLPVAALQREWRHLREAAGYPDVEFRAIRRSVATLIANGAGIDAAAAQLGHAGTAVTEKHYVEHRAAVAPDLTSLLQALA
ncbi:tyrosine-type recombinase/integrase [Gordonia sp. (in: high G+C Gram-positive bacteria)]|uniref:tyrosine-type recombinase/integrase n=1 Tax=Gordonia sp. (in: high G+C Gram-positive bacteria) TaxID=84139 RepID=UPI0026347CEC|nr:tyrosine-type recombinase/integrase [Gordonia sp. (in: high G+C Gram-positive bacteria)]